MFYVTGLDELCEPRRCQVSWFTAQSVCDRRAAASCGEPPASSSTSATSRFIRSATRARYSIESVCLFACLSVSRIAEKVVDGFRLFSGLDDFIHRKQTI